MLETPSDQDLNKAAIDLVFEAAQLRHTRRSGWHHVDADPESVAEHSHRASLLAFILAHKEGFPNPELVVAMVVLHDLHETRTGDDDLVQKQYVKVDGTRAAKDQFEPLGEAGKKMFEMWLDVEEKRNVAGIIAKDVDRLEMAFTARELVVKGHQGAQAWIEAVRGSVQTESAKELVEIVDRADPEAWWRDMFDFPTREYN